APATASANVFLFIVCFIVVLLCAPRAFQNMTGCKDDRLQNFWVTKRWRDLSVPTHRGTKAAPTLKPTAWQRRLSTQNCNQSAPASVITTTVDALSNTWMILTQARWFRLRFSMMMKQLARWCSGFIRRWQKSSGRIDHAEPPRRTFAK